MRGFDATRRPVAPLPAMHQAVKDMLEAFKRPLRHTRHRRAAELTPLKGCDRMAGLPEAVVRGARFTRV